MSAFGSKAASGGRWNYFMGSELHARERCSIEARKMAAGDQYRIKATEFRARAKSEANPRIRVEFENLAKASLRSAEDADWNERVEAVYDLCRQVRAGAKSKRRLYESARPTSAIQAKQVVPIKKTGGRMTRADLSEIARGIPFFVTLLSLGFLAVIVFW